MILISISNATHLSPALLILPSLLLGNTNLLVINIKSINLPARKRNTEGAYRWASQTQHQ